MEACPCPIGMPNSDNRTTTILGNCRKTRVGGSYAALPRDDRFLVYIRTDADTYSLPYMPKGKDEEPLNSLMVAYEICR